MRKKKTEKTNPYRILEEIVKEQMINILEKELDYTSTGYLYERLNLLSGLIKERILYEEESS